MDKPTARVSSVRIGRLYNLGNFEHIKYDIGVDVIARHSGATGHA